MALSAEIPELEQLEEDPFPDGEDDEVLHHMCREWFPVTAEQPDGGESTCTNCRLEFERKVEFELDGTCEDCGHPVFLGSSVMCCHAKEGCVHLFHSSCGNFELVPDPIYPQILRQYCMFHKPTM